MQEFHQQQEPPTNMSLPSVAPMHSLGFSYCHNYKPIAGAIQKGGSLTQNPLPIAGAQHMQGLLLYLGQPSIAGVTYKAFACHWCAWNPCTLWVSVQQLSSLHTQTHKQNKKITSLTFQQKQNRYVIFQITIQSFDPPCEHQHKFQQHITFFPSMGSPKVRSVPATQSLSFS